ncbi:glycosyltransferase family 117 protein [Ferruginibacter sp. SUN002]|uniref:glycosyltransferase family 117 protein n=1 Tax=Ferruginibacter sp. SUN002 TaxID=2937789 RepID=UPI003D36E99E
MNYKRINNITGWIVCFIACAVYLMTMEATGSLWDCGEFASSAYKLQTPHPPGAPLFVLIARLFMIPFSHNAALGANTMSALASGFTILFLFWSITHFAKKIVQKSGEELTGEKTFGIMAAGVVGALAYTFSDSFWYSAVESEVYALSSFFTAIVFWAILKWENAVTEEQKAGINGHFTSADRWLILIFYFMGLSIGVHLLNLLTIPAIVMIYYFKRYKVTNWGTFWAFVIGCVITGVVQKAVIQWTIKGAGNFDVLFVNDFGLPFFSGFAFFFVLLAVLIFWGIRVAKKKNWNFLRLGLWIFTFMLLGYSTYFTTLIRSNADTSIDMFNVDNPVSLVGYLAREQYGETPVLFGQDFTAEPIDSETEETYIKGKDKYEKNGRKINYVYADEDQHFFPRMWDASNDQGRHADFYASFAEITKNDKGEWDRKPTMGDNINFFMQYQVGWMYMRYFMWNFAGKQNDIQGTNPGNRRDGNWKFVDQKALPDTLKHNKANNTLFALPLILGILGLVFQFSKDRRDALVTGLLFFFTGFAIVVYLNMPGNQPRERDYAFVGSFYAFAIWIGLGVLFVKDQLSKLISKPLAGYAAAAVCTLAVPLLMASQEWDDHDRSNKTLARDLAINYLESCDKNAIVISYGDNDTYPLWYAQEVEGIRRDVRVINSSLLGTDWYINQLRYKVNDSDPIDVIWTKEQIEGPKRDAIISYPIAGVDPNQYMDLYTMMKDYAGSEDPLRQVPARGGGMLSVYPTKKVIIPVDVDLVRRNGTVNADDSVLTEIRFEIPKEKDQLNKGETAILNIIAANKWKRPIYFTSNGAGLGFDNYLRSDGLTSRLVPVVNTGVNRDWVYDKMMNKFVFGNCNKPGVYYDEENRRHLNSIRLAFAEAASNLADNGRKEEAKKLLHRCDSNMLQENFPYGMVSRNQLHDYFSIQFMEAAYKAGDFTLANKVFESLKKDLQQQITYYSNLSDGAQEALADDAKQADRFLKGIEQMKQQYTNPQPPVEQATPGKSTGTGTAPAKVADTPKKKS